MGIRKIPLIYCEEGDVLAEDVLSPYGVTLVVKDTEVNFYIVNKLMNQGIMDVCVYDSFDQPKIDYTYKEFNASYKESILYVKRIINDLASGKKLDYGAVLEVSDLILSSSNDNKLILKYLTDVRKSDTYTFTHCVNTSFYSMLIGKWLGFAEQDINQVIQAGLLHDIGKTKIPAGILNKKGRLTPGEFEVIKNHTIFGYELVEEIKDIDIKVKRAILLHHERIDASGYPFSAKEDDIDLYAKIVAVADVYDAMTSDRIYKKKVHPFEAFSMFLYEGVKMFDTSIRIAFLKNLATYYIGTNVVLSNGKIGEVVYIPPQNILYPVIRVNSEFIDLSRSDIKVVGII